MERTLDLVLCFAVQLLGSHLGLGLFIFEMIELNLDSHEM